MTNLRLAVAVSQYHDPAAERASRGNQPQTGLIVGDYNIRGGQALASHGHLEVAHPAQGALEPGGDQRIAVRDQHFDSVVGTHSSLLLRATTGGEINSSASCR